MATRVGSMEHRRGWIVVASLLGCGGEGPTEVQADASGSTSDVSGSSGSSGMADPGSTTGAVDDGSSGMAEGSTTGEPPSLGCGMPPLDALGGINVMLDAGPEGDGMRRFYLSLPADYDPQVPHTLIFGYAGTDWVGEMIAPYLQLESGVVAPQSDEIFVYPDPLWRDFEGWGNLGGWLLGPYATPADGEQDLVFTEAIIQYMEEHYCIDSERIFATGHSWGGDMAQVVGCFMSDRFAATVPVAANRPYWFEDGATVIDCPGDTAVWTMFGQDDTHFGSITPGLECRDFWADARGCNGMEDAVGLGLGDADDECVELSGCSAVTRFCLYGAQYGHQIPEAYFAQATMEFFRSF